MKDRADGASVAAMADGASVAAMAMAAPLSKFQC